MSKENNKPNIKQMSKRIEACRLAGGEALDLSGLKLAELPAEIKEFENLITLDLSFNQLEIIPEWLGSMTSLKNLDFSLNEKLKSLHGSLKHLCNLETLNFYGLPIRKIPKEVQNLKRLKVLSIGENSLNLPYPEWLSELSCLEELHLGSSTSEILEGIGNLKNLKQLKLSDDKIKTLPQSIGNLSSLRELYINSSNIRYLPESFGNLSALEKLELINTEIEEQPESFGNLRNLKKLRLFWI
jgi:Leucine-rich repeat (LRR) protein